jgi:hypothetical protein
MKKAFAIMFVLALLLSIGSSTGVTKGRTNSSPELSIISAFDELQDYIGNLPNDILAKGQRTSLNKKLLNAEKAYQRGQPCTAANILQAYLNNTQALHRGKRLEIAEDLFNRGWMLLYDLILSLPEGQSCPRFPRFGMEPSADIAESDNEHLMGTVSFGQPRMSTVKAEGKQFTQLNTPGIDPIGEPGLPGIPVLRRLIAVPWGAEVSVNVTASVREIIQNVNLYPFQDQARDQLVDQLPPPEYFADPPFTMNEEVYGNDTLFPADIVKVTHIGLFRDIRIAQVEVAAAQYNPVSKSLTLIEIAEFEVSFTGGPGTFVTGASNNPFESEPKKVFSEAVLNRNEIFEYVGPRIEHAWPGIHIGEEMLILTHPDFRAAADNLAQHRRDNGISTSVFEVNDGVNSGPDTNEEIDNFIEDRYENNLVRPSYILLMGDSEHIPTFYVPTRYDANTASDYEYAILDRCMECHGMATVPPPDFALGRIPVDTLAEAHTVVDKIITYESTPPVTAAFYNNISIASQFQCCRMDALGNPLNNPGTDQRAFIETSELVRDELLDVGYAVERIYTETIDAGGRCLNPPTCTVIQAAYNGNTTPSRYYNGTLLPAALRATSGFGWTGDTQDIIDAFNNGRFLVFHRDHGWWGGWGHPAFTNNNVTNDLTNGNLTPVVFSVNCSSGRFDANESFAERILRLDNGGAVGVIGDTRDSGTWVNNALSRGLFDAVWPNTVSGFGNNTSIRRLGDILNHSKLYVLDQVGVAQTAGGIGQGIAEDELYLYHVFGDPAMSMWTSQPLRALIREYTFTRFANRLQIFYAEEGAVITALQNGTPIGRAAVFEGEANLEFFVQPIPNRAIELMASKENFISSKLFSCYPDLTDPILNHTGTENYTGSDGNEYTRYRLAVTNSGDFPNELFVPSPHLPPCGSNLDASRTWVNIYDNHNNYLSGFCALASSDGMNSLWFSIPRGTSPPEAVYIELVDRECDITYTSNLVTFCYPDLPDPVLTYTGSEDYIGSDGNEYTRYNLEVTNSGDFPNELFAPSPHLPPCGLNLEASRTWVDIYDDTDNRLYGFCALNSSDGLKSIWFARLKGTQPPQSVYVTLDDRECNITYTSNNVSTTNN